jgi:hypothetical protein
MKLRISTQQPWYMPITPNRDPTPEMLEMPEERGGGGEERSRNALHRNGAGWSSGTPTAGMGDQNRRGFPLSLHVGRGL